MNLKLSIIIVNYQSEKYLAKCISSIQEKVLGVEYEIIVVNNDKNTLLEAKLPKEIKTINSGKNIGFGAACNLGSRMAQGEILCFLNPDTEIISEKITELIQEFNSANIGIVGPRLVDKKNNTQEWIAGQEVTILSTLLNNLGYKRDKKIWESNSPVECAWVSGAAMFIRKDIFQKLGGFDEKFFMYFEDTDLCRRARQLGHKVLYFPEFLIKHLGGKSFVDKKTQKAYYYKSQCRYFGKYFFK
jgi:GT2 family glycosyltransferase